MARLQIGVDGAGRCRAPALSGAMRSALPILPGLLASMLILPCPALADEPTLVEQQAVMEHFRNTFVLPQFTRWEFDVAKPYRLGGRLICGHVNFQNSNRVYQGEKAFYVVIKDGKYSEGGIVGNQIQDPSGATTFAYKILCARD
jgi:hypothetical protein